MGSTFDADVWLGGKRGEKSLPPEMQSWLSDGFKAKYWTEGDVPKEGVSFSKRDAGMWSDILDDSAAEAGEKAGKSHHRRLQEWLDIERQAMEAKDEKTTSAEYVPSKLCLEDMAAQGAKSHWDLIFSELSLSSGRPASRAELAGGIYGGPPSSI